MSYPKTLEEYTDNELFELMEQQENEVANLAIRGRDFSEANGRLKEIDAEVGRRDSVPEEEYCCDQCYQIDKIGFKVGGTE